MCVEGRAGKRKNYFQENCGRARTGKDEEIKSKVIKVIKEKPELSDFRIRLGTSHTTHPIPLAQRETVTTRVSEKPLGLSGA